MSPGGKWLWQLDVAKNASGVPASTPIVPPATEGEREFATEHVFEIQIIAQFFDSLKLSKVIKAELMKKVGSNNRSPIDNLAAALPSDREFIYLQASINGMKMVFFKMGRPTILSKKTITVKSIADAQFQAKEVLRKVTLIALLCSYMNSPPIIRLYNAVRGRIEAGLETLANSPIASYATTIKPLNLPAAFKEWHQCYIELLEQNMQDSIANGLAILKSILAQLQQNKYPDPKNLHTALQTSIEDFTTAMQEKGLKTILLRGLMTKLGEAPGNVDKSKLAIKPGNDKKAPYIGTPPESPSQGDVRGGSVEPSFGDADSDREEPEYSTVPGADSGALKGKKPLPQALPTRPAKGTIDGGKKPTPKTDARANPITTANRPVRARGKGT